MNRIYIALIIAAAFIMPAAAQTEFRHISFAEAKEAAAKEGKKIFIDFYTDWCGPCKRLATKVFPTTEVGDYLNANYVCLKIDAEKGEGVELAKKFDVHAYPTLVVAGADGEMIGSFSGLKEGGEFIASVEMCNNPDLQPQRVRERYESGERSTPLVMAYATMLREEATNAESMQKALGVLDDYFVSLPDNEKLDKGNIALLTTYTSNLSSPRVQFAISRYDDYAPEYRAQLDTIIHEAYREGITRYFISNSIKGNAGNLNDYNKTKQESIARGYGDEFSAMFDFIEKRNEYGNADYLAFCDKNFDRLNETEQVQFAYSVADIFQPETPDQKKEVSGLLRRHIAKMPATSLYWTATAILQLENEH